MRSTIVSPSATRPARTRQAEARRSVAMTVGAGERGPAVDAGVAPVEADVGAHARQLGGVLEAVLEDRLADRRQTLRPGS